MAATLGTVGLVLALWGSTTAQGVATTMSAVLLLAAVGAIDDFKSIPVTPRLLLQAAAVAIMLAAIPADAQIASFIPLWLERAILFLAALWFCYRYIPRRLKQLGIDPDALRGKRDH